MQMPENLKSQWHHPGFFLMDALSHLPIYVSHFLLVCKTSALTTGRQKFHTYFPVIQMFADLFLSGLQNVLNSFQSPTYQREEWLSDTVLKLSNSSLKCFAKDFINISIIHSTRTFRFSSLCYWQKSQRANLYVDQSDKIISVQKFLIQDKFFFDKSLRMFNNFISMILFYICLATFWRVPFGGNQSIAVKAFPVMSLENSAQTRLFPVTLEPNFLKQCADHQTKLNYV